MTYLIALIIAIALGAVIALLSFTNIGSGFSGQSDRAQAQIFGGAASQLEIALAAFDAAGGSVSDLDSVEDFQSVLSDSETEGWNGNWLRTDLKTPSGVTGSYELSDGVLSLSGIPTGVCEEIESAYGEGEVGIGNGCNEGTAELRVY